jgi:hypothetical protein
LVCAHARPFQQRTLHIEGGPVSFNTATLPEQLTVNSGTAELAGGNLVLEQQVDLAKRSILGLGQSEPTPNEAEEVGAGVEEGGFRAPVPSG